ncbi:hypothetical protein D3C81_617010 [compost metagenome]
MKKPFPTHPNSTCSKPQKPPSDICDVGQPPLFAVCAGVNVEDALVHAALYLKCASPGEALSSRPCTRWNWPRG